MDKKREPKAPGKKNIYKKSLALELIKRGNNFCHSMRNGRNSAYQVYVFIHDDKLTADIIDITTNKSQDR